MIGDSADDPLEECSVLQVDPKDVLLLRSTRALSLEQRGQLEIYFRDLFPENRLIILDHDMTLEILKQ